MRVLHLFANHKFTGPADPALVLAAAQSDLGAEVTFASSTPRIGKSDLQKQVSARGLESLEGLRLPKHSKGLATITDVTRLRRTLKSDRFDVVHCHLANDHLTATIATRGLEIPVVRSLYHLEPPCGRRARHSLGRSSLVLAPSAEAARLLGESGLIDEERIDVVPPVLDLERFNHRSSSEIREAWGCAGEDVVIGVVARMQPHRLFDLLIEGFNMAAREFPQIRLVILGRGTHQEEVAFKPARRSEFSQRIIFPGYIDPREYPRHLASFDLLIYLVPGSDGTCRAAREALASGVPVISTARGLLGELMPEGPGGARIATEEARSLADRLVELASSTESRQAHSRAAREFARLKFDPQRAAREVLEGYRAFSHL